jgi:hypothetical protein
VAEQEGSGALRRLAELLALTGFAIAQPVLDVTGRSPDFFLYRRPSNNDMRLLLLFVVAAPPLLLWAVELAVGLVSRAAARVVHLVLVAGLLAVLAVEVGKHLHLLRGVPLAVLGALAGVALAVVVARSERVRQALRYAAPAPLLFALVFTMTAPAGALVRPASGKNAVRAVAAKRPPVVFVFFDEFPLRALLSADGTIDATLFPNFARLAKVTTWYPNATGVSGWTPYAAPAMLSGRYPRKPLAPSYVEYPENLFTLLAGSGYDVKAFESITQLCPPQVCSGVPAGRATGLRALLRDTAGIAREIVSPNPSTVNRAEAFVEDVGAQGAAQRGKLDTRFRFSQRDANQPERFTSFLHALAPSPAPQLTFLHLLLPHTPWRFLPSRAAYDPPTTTFKLHRMSKTDTLGPDPLVAQVNKQRMLLQLVYTDGLVGQLIDRLQANGLWDESLVVVTADHGEGVEAGSRWRHLDGTNTPDLAWVPLFVKRPGQRDGAVDRRNEEQVDLLPSIADVLDLRIPWDVDGRSVYGPSRPEADKVWYDDPGKSVPLDTARWGPVARTGMASAVARPDLGVRGLFAPRPMDGLVGRPVSSFTVGAPATVTATMVEDVDVGHVRRAAGVVPAMLFGDLDQPLGARSTWLPVSVNGTVAGAVAAAHSDVDDRWHFMGLADESRFRDGANEVTLYVLDGNTLHPLRWRP